MLELRGISRQIDQDRMVELVTAPGGHDTLFFFRSGCCLVSGQDLRMGQGRPHLTLVERDLALLDGPVWARY